MVQNNIRKRGRPRQFDPEATILAAMQSFWQNGFAATSLDDLSEATGLNRPSLYGAFGDKRALYGQTIAAYRAAARQSLAQALSGALPLREELASLYTRALTAYLDKGGQGCFVISTATSEARHDAAAREALAGTLQDLETALETRFRLAVARAELPASASPQGLAAVSSSGFFAMALRARAGATRAELERIASATADLVCGTP